MKVYTNGPGHTTRMTTMPIYDLNINLLLQNQIADDLECDNYLKVDFLKIVEAKVIILYSLDIFNQMRKGLNKFQRSRALHTRFYNGINSMDPDETALM